MKLIKTFALIFIVSVLFSCKNETNTVKKINVSQKKTANYKKAEFHIKGMTCEIGCARLIQSKLSKIAGVKSIDIVFKDSIGRIEFDNNILNKQKIKQVVEQIAGGDLYKITDINDVDVFTVKK